MVMQKQWCLTIITKQGHGIDGIPFLCSRAVVTLNHLSLLFSYLKGFFMSRWWFTQDIYLSGDKELENLGIGHERTDKQAILSIFSSLSALSSQGFSTTMSMSLLSSSATFWGLTWMPPTWSCPVHFVIFTMTPALPGKQYWSFCQTCKRCLIMLLYIIQRR